MSFAGKVIVQHANQLRELAAELLNTADEIERNFASSPISDASLDDADLYNWEMCRGPDVIDPEDLADVARRLYAERRTRHSFWPEDVFGDPAWDMMLDLYLRSQEGVLTSVKRASIASNTTPATAQRYISLLENMGLVERVNLADDIRIAYVKLSKSGNALMAGYLTNLFAGDRFEESTTGHVPKLDT